MPDICMCSGEGCPRKAHCHRYTATPSEQRQAYFKTPPITADGTCAHEWPHATGRDGEKMKPDDIIAAINALPAREQTALIERLVGDYLRAAKEPEILAPILAARMDCAGVILLLVGELGVEAFGGYEPTHPLGARAKRIVDDLKPRIAKRVEQLLTEVV